MLVRIRPQTWLNVIGIVILLAGLGVGSFLYWQSFQDRPETDEEVLAMQYQSKAYEGQVERNVGVFGSLMARGSDTLGKFGEPRPLAGILLIVCSVTAGGLFLAASRRGGDPDPGEPGR